MLAAVGAGPLGVDASAWGRFLGAVASAVSGGLAPTGTAVAMARVEDANASASDVGVMARPSARGLNPRRGEGSRPSVARLRAGDPAAWRWFVDEYGHAIVNYARRMGHRDPEEVMGATLETVARGIARFEGGHGQLRSFVFSVAHARIVDDLRKRSRREDLGSQHLETLREEESPDFDADGRLLDALEHLSESQRMMIYLRYVEGLSTKETARAVGKSEVATRVALSRGLSQLRDILNGAEL